jgi:hypothetical protein
MNVALTITTHSPFIVSAVKDVEDCRVYLMKDRQPCDLTGRFGTDAASSGFAGRESLLAAHSLLGSGIDDFVPSLTFCENSVHIFLRAIAARGGPAVRSCIQTVPGDSEALRKSSTLSLVYESLLKHVNQNGPSNGTIPGSIGVIVDGPLSGSDEKYVAMVCEKRRFTISRLGDKLELEANYPARLIKEFFTHQFGENPSDQSTTKSLVQASKNHCSDAMNSNAWVGQKKSELANYVVEKASTSELSAMKSMVEDLYRNL